jgi:hypothetical protein
MIWAVPSTGVSAGTVSGLVGVPTCNTVTPFQVDCHLVSPRSFPDVNSVRLHVLSFTQFTFLFIYSFLFL